MSEYQYYEFTAIDRPLTQAEVAELRRVSTRARIGASGFVNSYQWGDLKADPADWMRRYFDAHVYFANWCSCSLSLRLPASAFEESQLECFAAGDALTIDSTPHHWILRWALDDSEDYDRFGAEDGSEWMGRLVGLRDELLRGDLRPLYLGWLACAGGLDVDALEPDVPPGLAQLSGAQQALVDFIEIDPDLLAAAALGSPALDKQVAAEPASEEWLAGWSDREMRAIIQLLAEGRAAEAERQVRERLLGRRQTKRPSRESGLQRRSVGRLRELVPGMAADREAREAKQRAAKEDEERRRREAALRRLMQDVDKHWLAVDALASRGSASTYSQAVQLLKDLAAGHALVSSPREFDRRLARLLATHGARGALLRRLKEAELWPG